MSQPFDPRLPLDPFGFRQQSPQPIYVIVHLKGRDGWIKNERHNSNFGDGRIEVPSFQSPPVGVEASTRIFRRTFQMVREARHHNFKTGQAHIERWYEEE